MESEKRSHGRLINTGGPAKSEKELAPRHDTDQWCRKCCYNMGEKSIGQIGFGQMFV